MSHPVRTIDDEMTRTLHLPELAAELTRVIDFARVDCGYIVIVSHENYYLQFAFRPGWILCEAVSNEYLEGCWQLTELQQATLRLLGWHDPNGIDPDGLGHRNYHRSWLAETPTANVVRDAVNTLVAVYLDAENATVDLNVFPVETNEEGDPITRFGDYDPEVSAV